MLDACYLPLVILGLMALALIAGAQKGSGMRNPYPPPEEAPPAVRTRP